MTSKEKNRFDYLDVLRGAAVVAVCFQHLLGYIYHTYDASHPLFQYIRFLIAESVDWGRFGVVLFFLISGFIIPFSLKPGSRLAKFFTSRVFRLYPAYWIALVLIVISAPYLGGGQQSYSYAQFFANITMVPKLFGINEMSGVFWTLFIEILFYVCCVCLFKLKLLDKSIVVALVAIGLNLTTPLALVLNKFFLLDMPVQFILFHLSFLFAGNLLRLAFVIKDRLAGYSILIFLLLNLFTVPLVSGLVFLVPEAASKGFVMFTSEAVVYAYALAIGVFLLATHYKSFNNKFMVELGKISYSLYLLHMLCFVLVTKFVQPATVPTFFAYLVLSSFLSYAIAKISYRYIEYPAMEFGRKIIISRGYT
ncbi:MAG: acyltransferase [Methylotenera sp.]